MSLLNLLLEQRDEEAQKLAYRIIAERAKTRVLDPDEAQIVADWFDRLGAGEDPAKVSPKFGGRPKGKTAERTPMPDGRIPDDYDVAWVVKQNLERGIKPGDVYAGVARAFGMNKTNVRNIWVRLKGEIASL